MCVQSGFGCVLCAFRTTVESVELIGSLSGVGAGVAATPSPVRVAMEHRDR